MFTRKKDSKSPELNETGAPRISSVIAEDISITGKLSGEGGLRIEGKFNGEIELESLLVIGEGAIITTKNILATRIIISGQVHGNIIAKSVEIMPTGKVWGDIETENFTIEEGAFLHGKVSMLEPPSSVEK